MYVHTHTHTHKILGVDDRERGRQMKVRGKLNVIQRVGYTVYVGSEKVCLTDVRVYKTLSSINRDKPRNKNNFC